MPSSRSPEQRAWLGDHAERDDRSSTDGAVRRLLDGRISGEHADLAWARPYVEEARAEAERGNVIGRKEHRARNAARLATSKG